MRVFAALGFVAAAALLVRAVATHDGVGAVEYVIAALLVLVLLRTAYELGTRG